MLNIIKLSVVLIIVMLNGIMLAPKTAQLTGGRDICKEFVGASWKVCWPSFRTIVEKTTFVGDTQKSKGQSFQQYYDYIEMLKHERVLWLPGPIFSQILKIKIVFLNILNETKDYKILHLKNVYNIEPMLPNLCPVS